MEGYSGTPLAKKLGIKPGFKIHLFNCPPHYKSLFIDFPEDIIETKRPLSETVNFIHIFCRSEAELSLELLKLKPFLEKDGMIWVSWPKNTSMIQTDLNRDLVRRYMLSKIKLVDVKVAAIDKDWSGLKFVYRKEDRN